MKKNIGLDTNHLTGETTPFVKMKDQQHVRCISNIEVIDGTTGEVTRSISNIENASKDAIHHFAASLGFMSDTVFNNVSDSDSESLISPRWLVLLDDSSGTETSLYNDDEGIVQGYVDLHNNYGGNDINRGNRRQVLSGVFIDPDTDEIVYRVGTIFDETTINGKTINKLALTRIAPLESYPVAERHDKDTYLERNHMAMLSHRYISNGSNKSQADSFEFRVSLDCFYNHPAKSHPMRANYAKAFGHIYCIVDFRPELQGLHFRYLDLSVLPDAGEYNDSHMKSFSLQDAELELSSTYHYQHERKELYLVKVDDKINITYYNATTLDGVLRIKDTLSITPDATPDKSRSVAVFVTGNMMSVFYSASGTLHVTTVNLDDKLKESEQDTTLSLSAMHVADMGNGLVMLAYTNHRFWKDSSGNYVGLTGGCLDLNSNRFVQTFAANPDQGRDGKEFKSPSIKGMLPNNTLSMHYKYHSFFCVRTGRITMGHDGPWYVASPVDLVPPRIYTHVNRIPEIVKSSSEQLKVYYEIRTPNRLKDLANPFDRIYNLGAGESMMRLLNSTSVEAKSGREHRFPAKTTPRHKTPSCPSLENKVFYSNTGYLYIDIKHTAQLGWHIKITNDGEVTTYPLVDFTPDHEPRDPQDGGFTYSAFAVETPTSETINYYNPNSHASGRVAGVKCTGGVFYNRIDWSMGERYTSTWQRQDGKTMQEIVCHFKQIGRPKPPEVPTVTFESIIVTDGYAEARAVTSGIPSGTLMTFTGGAVSESATVSSNGDYVVKTFNANKLTDGTATYTCALLSDPSVKGDLEFTYEPPQT